jgi:hypothetical protein
MDDDHLLEALSRKDREAVLARFFEGKCHREVARALGVSEAAAKVRVSRAVAKLRLSLISRSVLVPSATLLATLGTYAAKAAPAGLANSVALGAATSGSSGSAASVWMAERVIAALAWGKAKTAIMTAAVLIVAGGAVTVAIQPWRTAAGLATTSTPMGWDRSTPKRTLSISRQC